VLFGDLDGSVSEQFRDTLQWHLFTQEADGEGIAEAVRVTVWYLYLLTESAECAAVVANRGIDVAFARPKIVSALIWLEFLEGLDHKRRERNVNACTGFHATEQ
jgi:hypothetical protein